MEEVQVARLRQAVEAEWDKEKGPAARSAFAANVVIVNKPVGLCEADLKEEVLSWLEPHQSGGLAAARHR
jgi:hypothetical protein